MCTKEEKNEKYLISSVGPEISPVPEFIDPRFRENKSKTLEFSHRKRAFWACFRENCVLCRGLRRHM